MDMLLKNNEFTAYSLYSLTGQSPQELQSIFYVCTESGNGGGEKKSKNTIGNSEAFLLLLVLLAG